MEVQKFEGALPKRRVLTVVGDLNDDLLVQVLVRLPCKYVVRSKCVCKRWMSLISNPMFINYFLDHHRISGSSSSSKSQNKQQLRDYRCWRFIGFFPSKEWMGEKEVRFLAGCGRKRKVELPFFRPGLHFLPRMCSDDPVRKAICVVGSCNDLILCSRGYNDAIVYYICNPVTKQFLKLPPPPHVHEMVCIGFVCEPLSLYPNHRCRVVRIILPYQCRSIVFPLEMEIFSSETGLWSKKTLGVSAGVTKRECCGAKLVSFENGQMIFFGGSYIIKFDALAAGRQSEVIVRGELIDLPRVFFYRPMRASTRSVVTSQGRLLVLRISLVHINVWEERNDKDGESKWMLIHHIKFKEMKAIQQEEEDPGVDIEDLESMYPTTVSPHSKEHRRTWLGLFLKGLYQNRHNHCFGYEVVFVGFGLNCSRVMYLILCPPEPALAAFAAYNMRTRAIRLLPRGRVPLHLRCLTCYGKFWTRDHHMLPFVLQPWPTPLPQVSL